MGCFFTSLLKSAVLTSIPRQTVRDMYGTGYTLPSWGAALCTIFCSSAVSVQLWGSLQQNRSLILLHQWRSLIKPLKRRTKNVCIIFSSIPVTTTLGKSVKEGSEESGLSCSLTPTTFCSPSGQWEGDLKYAMIGKHSTGCIKDIEGNINHIPGYLVVLLVQTLYANIRHIDK